VKRSPACAGLAQGDFFLFFRSSKKIKVHVKGIITVFLFLWQEFHYDGRIRTERNSIFVGVVGQNMFRWDNR